MGGLARLVIFITYRNGNNSCWSEGGRLSAVRRNVPAHFFDQLTQTEFDGQNYWIPEQYDEYLTYRYKNLRTPLKDRDHLADDYAITLAKSAAP